MQKIQLFCLSVKASRRLYWVQDTLLRVTQMQKIMAKSSDVFNISFLPYWNQTKEISCNISIPFLLLQKNFSVASQLETHNYFQFINFTYAIRNKTNKKENYFDVCTQTLVKYANQKCTGRKKYFQSSTKFAKKHVCQLNGK